LEQAKDEHEKAECALETIEYKMNELKECMRSTEVKEFLGNKAPTGDNFIDSLIMASWFCMHYDDGPRPLLENIKIGDNTVIACDGNQAIEVTCNCIPNEFKNSYIHWKNSSSPKTNTTVYDNQYPNLSEIIFRKVLYPNYMPICIKELREKWLNVGSEQKHKNETHIEIGEVKYLFDIGLLTNVLDALSIKESGELYYNQNNNPIMIIADNIKVALMPLRYREKS